MIFQPFANALLSASAILLVGLGFHLIFRVGRFFHFAHGGVFTVAPYLTFVFGIKWGLPAVVSAVLAVVISTFLGCLMELFFYRPIRQTNNSANTLLLCSLGIFIVLQATLSLCFGSETKSLRLSPVTEGWPLLGVRLTTAQITIVLSSAALLVSTWLFMRRTKAGRQLEAVANDSFLARVIGIRIERMFLLSIGLGSALAAVAGILVSYDVDMNPTMGMYPMMLGVIAVIVGGNSIWGTAGGALLIGAAQHLTGFVWLPSRWQDTIVFLLLLFFLFFKPQGILGSPLRKTSV
jgi:branched-chain amino acid transport system permease protein